MNTFRIERVKNKFGEQKDLLLMGMATMKESIMTKNMSGFFQVLDL